MTSDFISLPPKRQKTRAADAYKLDEAVHKAMTSPGMALKVAEDVPRNLYASIYSYTSAPYVTEEGHVQVNMRNSRKDPDGIRRGDLYFTWITHDKDQ